MVGITQQMIGVGFIVSTWVGYGSAQVPKTSSFSWRFPLAFQTVPCCIIILGLLFFPESPRQLIEKGKEEEGMRVVSLAKIHHMKKLTGLQLQRLHFNGRNGEWCQNEFDEIKATIAAEREITVPGWLPMFTVKPWRARLVQAILVQVFTQFSGINVIGYYQTIMYENLGITGNRNLLVTGIYNCIGPLASKYSLNEAKCTKANQSLYLIFILFILDRVGRKKPLLFGTIGITVALICEAAIGSRVKPGVENKGLQYGGVFFLFAVSVIFSLSFGPGKSLIINLYLSTALMQPVSWVYMSEVMPMQIRARGSAFGK